MDEWHTSIFVRTARQTLLPHKIFAKKTLPTLPYGPPPQAHQVAAISTHLQCFPTSAEPIANIAMFLTAKEAVALSSVCTSLHDALAHDMVWDFYLTRDFDSTARVRGRFGSSLEPGSSRLAYLDRARMHVDRFRSARIDPRGFTLCELPAMLRQVTVFLFPAPAFFVAVTGTLVTLTLWLDGAIDTRGATAVAPWIIAQLLALLFIGLVAVSCLASCGLTPLSKLIRVMERKFDVTLCLPHLLRLTYDILPFPLPLEHLQRKWRMRWAQYPAQGLPIIALCLQVLLLIVRYLLREESEAAERDDRAIRLQLAPGMETVAFPLRWLLGVTISVPAFLLYWPIVIYAVFIGPLLPSSWTTPHESTTVPETARLSAAQAAKQILGRWVALAPVFAYVATSIRTHGALFAVEVTPPKPATQELLDLGEALGLRNASSYLATLENVVSVVGIGGTNLNTTLAPSGAKNDGSAQNSSGLFVWQGGNGTSAHSALVLPFRTADLPLTWFMASQVLLLCSVFFCWLWYQSSRASAASQRRRRVFVIVASSLCLPTHGRLVIDLVWGFMLACANVVSAKARRQFWWVYYAIDYLMSHYYTAGSAALILLLSLQLNQHLARDDPSLRRRRNHWAQVLGSDREARALSMHAPFAAPALGAMLLTTVMFCLRLDLGGYAPFKWVPYWIVMAPLLLMLLGMSIVAVLCSVHTLYESLESRDRYYWGAYGTFMWELPVWHGLRPARKRNLLE